MSKRKYDPPYGKAGERYLTRWREQNIADAHSAGKKVAAKVAEEIQLRLLSDISEMLREYICHYEQSDDDDY